MGAFLFISISTKIINPSNMSTLHPEYIQMVKNRFKLMMRWLLFFWFLIISAAVVLVWKGPVNVEKRTPIESSEV